MKGYLSNRQGTLTAEWPQDWKDRPIFGNEAKTVAEISNIQLKIQNIYIELLPNVIDAPQSGLKAYLKHLTNY
jgi:hypothetical protein